MIAEVKVGQQVNAEGTQTIARGSRTGAVVVAQGHSAYAEAAYRGAVMEVSNAVAGVAPGTVLSTTPPIILWNPPSSGKNLVVIKASFGYVSGTLGAGTIVLAAVLAQATIPTTGTELTPVCSLIGASRGVGRAFTGSTLVSTPQIVRPLFQMGAFTAATAQVPVDCVDVLDGAIIVTPGTTIVMQEVGAAGTTPLGIFAFTYEEVPV